MIILNFNGKDYQFDVIEDMFLFWVICDVVGYIGIKFGCGMGLCGFCIIYIDGQVICFCIMLVSLVQGRKVIIIDYLYIDKVGEVVQQVWLDIGVVQCGYCQGGQIMLVMVLLKSNFVFSDEQIEVVMVGNICCCGIYNWIKMVIYNVFVKLQEVKV